MVCVRCGPGNNLPILPFVQPNIRQVIEAVRIVFYAGELCGDDRPLKVVVVDKEETVARTGCRTVQRDLAERCVRRNLRAGLWGYSTRTRRWSMHLLRPLSSAMLEETS